MPIESILGLLQLLVSVFISYKLYQSVKNNPENVNIAYFYYTFILLSIVFAFSAFSVISIMNFKADFLISAINIIGRGLILLGVMFFAYIPLNILKDDFWRSVLPISVLIVAVSSNLFSLMSLFNYPRTPVGEVGIFVVRLHRGDLYTQIGVGLIGLAAISSLILATYKYFKVIYRDAHDSYVFNRGLLIVGAALLFILGIASNYFLAFYLPIFGRVFSEIIFLIALICFAISVLYKKDKNLVGSS